MLLRLWAARAPLVSVCLLGLIVVLKGRVGQESSRATTEARPHIDEALREVPWEAEGWIGRALEAPKPAVPLLGDHSVLCRKYEGPRGSGELRLLVVHAERSDDLFGYSPAALYPARGWSEVSHRDRTWHVAGRTIGGSEYVFDYRSTEGDLVCRVEQVLLNPEGLTTGELSDSRALSLRATRSCRGGTAIIFELEHEGNAREQDAVVQALLSEILGALQPIEKGQEERQDEA